MGSCSSASTPATDPPVVPIQTNIIASSTDFPNYTFESSLFASKPNEYDYLFKFLLIGTTGAGKSSLLMRFVDDKFEANYISTIGVDFKIKTIELEGKRIKLQIWDTAGQERFKTVTNAYFRGSHGIVLVYDITSTTSFEAVDYWLGEVSKYAPRNAVKLVVGNKTDLKSNRAIATQTAALFAQEKEVFFLEASAKDATNVAQAFLLLAGEIKHRIVTSLS